MALMKALEEACGGLEGAEHTHPPCLGNALHKNRPLVPQSSSRTPFFTRVLGFSWFWWM